MKIKDSIFNFLLIVFHPHRWFKGRNLIFSSAFRGEKDNNLKMDRVIIKKCFLTFNGQNNSIVAHNCEIFGSTIYVRGEGHSLIIEEGVRLYNMHIKIIGSGNTVHIGRSTSFGGGNLISGGSQISIIIGDNCMIAEGVDIWSTDTHSVLQDGVLVNEPKSITIGNHVWCGKDVAILKGVTIGDNAVIGMRSLVTKDIHPGTLNVGSPAKEIRKGIEWTRINPNN